MGRGGVFFCLFVFENEKYQAINLTLEAQFIQFLYDVPLEETFGYLRAGFCWRQSRNSGL